MSQGEDLERKAEKKLHGWSLFGNKFDEASELFEKAGNSYKLAKEWDKAAAVYIKLAECHLKLESKHEAASAYVDAANCYKKTNSKEAVNNMIVAVQLFMEIGRLSMAAKHYKEIAEIFEKDEALAEAMEYYEKSAELYEGEESTSQGNSCRLKVAQFAALLEQYPKAIEIFENVAGQSINNNLLRYSVKGYLLNAGLCHLCASDNVAIAKALEKYQELDPAFSGSRECKLLTDLAVSIEEEDVDKYTDAVKEFDSMTRLEASFKTVANKWAWKERQECETGLLQLQDMKLHVRNNISNSNINGCTTLAECEPWCRRARKTLILIIDAENTGPVENYSFATCKECSESKRA